MFGSRPAKAEIDSDKGEAVMPQPISCACVMASDQSSRGVDGDSGQPTQRNLRQQFPSTPACSDRKTQDRLNAMGIGPVCSSSDEEDNSELTDLETRSRMAKPPKGLPQTMEQEWYIDSIGR